uniref:Primosome PriB/single-strand DNA-binding n=1 Tax=Davidia involucrata TaxID=16924 RepID=A0A5B7C394_DAVIN
MVMEACRLRTLLRNLASFSLHRLRPFSSSSAAASPRDWRFFSDDNSEGGSSVYRHALKFQRPSTIKWQKQLRNSVRFIGTVDLPLKRINFGSGKLGVHTVLNVKTSRNSNRPVKILLLMLDEMAEISMKHLKPNDFIYVSGHLGSYTKADGNGKLVTKYKVTVKEINYVMQHGQGSTCQKSEQSESGRGETGLEKYKNRLHLWQVFFASPNEWWDNRKSKRKSEINPKHPDFKHKDTGEALWLSTNDPSWIKRQFQLHDSRLAEGGQGEDGSHRSRVSQWVYDE